MPRRPIVLRTTHIRIASQVGLPKMLCTENALSWIVGVMWPRGYSRRGNNSGCSTQPLLPAVSALLPPQYGTYSLLAFALVLHHILSVVFLKPTVSIRPSVPPSGSHKCLRFGLWSTRHCTIKDFIYLLIYLVTYLLISLSSWSWDLYSK